MIKYFYVENAFNGTNTLKISLNTYNLEYTITPEDETSWTNYTQNYQMQQQGDRIYLRGTNKSIKNITCEYDYNVGGDATTLLSPEGNVLDLTGYCLKRLFMDDASGEPSPIIDASNLELPSTILSHTCYYGMFMSSTLVTPPRTLPTAKTAKSCYRAMFKFCSSLQSTPEMTIKYTSPWSYAGMFHSCDILSSINITIDCNDAAPHSFASMFQNSYTLTSSFEILPAMNLTEGCYEGMFALCEALIKAPKLPATQLADNCYASMFAYCTSLIKAPKLPATKLAICCYDDMFDGCSSLQEISELPATELYDGCYRNMFCDCESIKQPIMLPAKKMTKQCYQAMFKNCTSLQKAPMLSSMELADYCYQAMFYGCSSLTTAPDLPATQLTTYCYEGMFGRCINITKAPILLARELVNNCYTDMFNGCTKINKVIALFVNAPEFKNPEHYIKNWVYNTAPIGEFISSVDMDEVFKANVDVKIKEQYSQIIPKGWDRIENTPNYFYIENAYDGDNTISIDRVVGSMNCKPAKNPGWNTNKEGNPVNVTLHKGDKWLFRGTCSTIQYKISSTHEINIGGDLTTLLNKDGYVYHLIDREGCFENMFKDTEIKDASSLVLGSQILSPRCYAHMFENCSKLICTPKVYVISVEQDCFKNMFKGCTSLTKANVSTNNVFGYVDNYIHSALAGTPIQNVEIKALNGDGKTYSKIISYVSPGRTLYKSINQGLMNEN